MLDSIEWERKNLQFTTDNIEAVKNADITVFGVPIAYMEQTIIAVAPHLKKWSVAADICSIKWFPSELLQQHSWDGVLVIPTHPMFAPCLQSISGQIFVLTPEESVLADSRYIFLKSFLESAWSQVIESTPDEHDKMMAVVQWLTHFDFFVFAETIKRLWVDIKKSLDFVSPVYKIMLSSVSRYMSQNPRLYGDIQMYNPEILWVHKVFIDVSKDFNQYIESGDQDAFVSTIEGTQEYFWENAQKWQVYTDKIIYMLAMQIEYLNKNIWNELNFTHVSSWKKIQSVVKGFEKEVIYLESWEELILDEWFVEKF